MGNRTVVLRKGLTGLLEDDLMAGDPVVEPVSVNGIFEGLFQVRDRAHAFLIAGERVLVAGDV